MRTDVTQLHRHDVVCTAGHVDHGKSALVRALTGMEPDRLAEERRRGLSIRLGYGWTTIDGRPTAFVDVPGHERFLPTMLAGAGPAKTVLFAVAADGGWSRQSSEHLAVLDLLGVRHGVVALTRADLVTPDQLAAAREATAAALAGTTLAALPLVVTAAAAPDGPRGLEELRAALAAARHDPRDEGRPRLWVDRAFTVAGAGRVVTGTLDDGPIAVGDELVVLPGGTPVRVRGLECLGEAVDAAGAGTRVALALGGGVPAAPGDVVVRPDQWHSTRTVEAWLRPVGADVGVRGDWRLHVGSTEVGARVVPLRGATLEGPATVELDAPVVVRAGDAFVLRETGRRGVLGGGTVLDPAPAPRPRGRRARQERAQALERRRSRPRDPVRYSEAHGYVRADHLARATGRGSEGLHHLGDHVVSEALLQTWRAAVLAALARAHAAEPARPDVAEAVARDAATAAGCPPELAASLLSALLSDGLVVRRGERIRAADHRPRLSAAGTAAARRLLALLEADPFRPPALSAAARRAGADGQVVAHLMAAGRVVRVAPDLVFSARAVASATAVLRRLPQPFTASAARQAWGTTRRYALPLLEYLDGAGVTDRDGDVRRVAGQAEDAALAAGRVRP